MLSLLRHEDWKRIGVIYEEENKYWTHFRDIILERSDIHVAKVMEVPKVNKFNRYGEYFLEFPEMEQRNQSLAKLRYVLTDMAHKEKIKGKPAALKSVAVEQETLFRLAIYGHVI